MGMHLTGNTVYVLNIYVYLTTRHYDIIATLNVPWPARVYKIIMYLELNTKIKY